MATNHLTACALAVKGCLIMLVRCITPATAIISCGTVSIDRPIIMREVRFMQALGRCAVRGGAAYLSIEVGEDVFLDCTCATVLAPGILLIFRVTLSIWVAANGRSTFRTGELLVSLFTIHICKLFHNLIWLRKILLSM